MDTNAGMRKCGGLWYDLANFYRTFWRNGCGAVAIRICRTTPLGVCVRTSWATILVLCSVEYPTVGNFRSVLSLHVFVGEGVLHQLDCASRSHSRTERHTMTNTPTKKDVDDLVYTLRQKGDDSTYALVIAVLAKWGTPQPVAREPQCWCLTCRPMRVDDPESIRMALCPTCGNKRCPKANNHRNQCSNSNEPGQKGSAYEGCGITQKGGNDGL